jgi:predicted NAD/FAD-binding protein
MGRSFAVVGAGVSGLAAAWLLSQRHDVIVYEAEPRAGGHSHTQLVQTRDQSIPVDTGFIVLNPGTYPNLVALLDHLGVESAETAMTFAVSLDGGRFEYSGAGLPGLIGQPANALRPSHWRMIADILRFFRHAPALVEVDDSRPLGEYLAAEGYGAAFIDRHIVPMASAIWSCPPAEILAHPVGTFVRFFASHGLLRATRRPKWRTVKGGSHRYVERLAAGVSGGLVLGAPVVRIDRAPAGVEVVLADGRRSHHDRVLIACHADQALRLLAHASPDEKELLGAFGYAPNDAILHRDVRLMPKRQRLWSSWNYLGSGGGHCSVTYWMNSLQPLATSEDIFVTLNCAVPPRDTSIINRMTYRHPIFNGAAMAAQRQLWRLQGVHRTWFAGSYFGYGFHEDGLQAGLLAAEEAGGVRRPWAVASESGRVLARQTGQPRLDWPEAA